MPCYSPLIAYRSTVVNSSGKRGLVFNPRDGFVDMPVNLPCGQCIGCRLEYSRQWAIRCMHESMLHTRNSFITLTYDNDNLPQYGDLRYVDFQRFIKRLRKNTDIKFRYFVCGEYGETTGRPHYHALLFGLDFDDKFKLSNNRGNPLFVSELLTQTWGKGHASIGSVSYDSAAYVARYIVKKHIGKDLPDRYNICDDNGMPVFDSDGVVKSRTIEFAKMSRRPGIGADYYTLHKDNIYAKDTIVVNGKLMRPPRYYDSKYSYEHPDNFATLVARRRAAMSKREVDTHNNNLKAYVKAQQCTTLNRKL